MKIREIVISWDIFKLSRSLRSFDKKTVVVLDNPDSTTLRKASIDEISAHTPYSSKPINRDKIGPVIKPTLARISAPAVLNIPFLTMF